jgi:hypothetical protein
MSNRIRNVLKVACMALVLMLAILLTLLVLDVGSSAEIREAIVRTIAVVGIFTAASVAVVFLAGSPNED